MHTFASTFANTLAAALLLAGTLVMPTPASATPVQLHGQATASGGFGGSTQFMALGTVVTANLWFDVSGSTTTSGTGLVITDAQGTFTWNDGTARTFDVNSGRNSYLASSGFIGLEFAGLGPTINGLSTPWFWVDLQIGANPFTLGQNWDDLLIGASVFGFQLMASDPSGFGTGLQMRQEPSGEVSLASVPEPGSIALVAVALVAALLAKRRGLRAQAQA